MGGVLPPRGRPGIAHSCGSSCASSCSSGQADGAAARLSRELGVDVKAPTDTVWIHPDGTLTVGPTPDAPSGGWSRTSPDGASEVVEGSARVGDDGLRVADDAVAAGPKEALDQLRDPTRDTVVRVASEDLVRASKTSTLEWRTCIPSSGSG